MKKFLTILLLAVSLLGYSQIYSSPYYSSASGGGGGYGSEMISNGDFADSTTWGKGIPSDCNFIGEQVNALVGSGNAFWQDQEDMTIAVEVDTDYVLTWDQSGSTGTEFWIGEAGTSVDYNGGYTEYNNGANEIFFTTPSDINLGGLQFYPNSSSAYVIDNVSLKEVL